MLLATLAPAIGLTGCQRAAMPNPMPIDAAMYDPVYDASIAVLRDAGFRVVRRDYRFGEVVTDPKGSPTFVEFWSRDNTTLDQKLRSTFSDLRRTVRVELDRWDEEATEATGNRANGTGDTDEAAAAYGVRVEVSKERRQIPVRRMTGSVQTGVFRHLAAVPGEWSARGIRGSYWEPIGRDAHMEQRLLRRITRRAARQAEAIEGPEGES